MPGDFLFMLSRAHAKSCLGYVINSIDFNGTICVNKVSRIWLKALYIAPVSYFIIVKMQMECKAE